ncbi:MAG: flagellar biosynthesis protein FliQ [bacterium]
METGLVIQIGTDALKTVLMVSAPLLGIALVVGLLVSLLQAVTQIQEMTLTFVPKILGLMLGLMAFSSWMLDRLLGFTTDIIRMIPEVIR